MANLFGSNMTNITNKFSNATMQDNTRNVPLEVSNIASIVINSIACPITVLLNVLVIMAVKRRPRLQSNTNILLACLAVTDALTGLAVQPSFITWKAIYVLKNVDSRTVKLFHNLMLRVVSVSSSLHLMLVTCERLMAIKFTMHYPYIMKKRNITVAVLTIWAFTFLTEVIYWFSKTHNKLQHIRTLLVSLTMIVCIVFIVLAYIILYRETLRQRRKIKTQQLPQEEVERFIKESKALKTTVFVVGAVTLSFLPMALHLIAWALNKKYQLISVNEVLVILQSLVRTFAMLNSLLNPLIYCLRQEEMRKFVLRLPCQAVHPVN